MVTVERPTARQAAVLGAVLVGWTIVLALLLSPSHTPTHRPTPPAWRSLAALPRIGGGDAAEVEQRWADQLLTNLEETSADEASAATLSELRATFDSRDRSGLLGVGTQRRIRHAGQDASTPPPGTLSLPLPRYDPNQVSELLSAAGSVAVGGGGGAGASGGDGSVSRLVRDMGSALSRMEKEQTELHVRLAALQPSVANYNPKDVESLTRAAELATSREEVYLYIYIYRYI